MLETERNKERHENTNATGYVSLLGSASTTEVFVQSTLLDTPFSDPCSSRTRTYSKRLASRDGAIIIVVVPIVH